MAKGRSVDPPMSAEKHEGWDRLGQGLSAACLLHCLATPLLLGALPSLGLLMHSEVIHLSLAAVIVLVSVWAFGRGFLRHRRPLAPILGAVGVVSLLVAALVIEPQSQALGTAGTVVASIVLVVAHTVNRGGLSHAPARAA